VPPKKPATKDALWELINIHQRLRPKLEIQDVYKLLYQSVFGVGHIIGAGGQALECLKRELESIDPRIQPEEELVENISLDGHMVRINLRPFRRRGLEAEKLFEAMKLSSETGLGRQNEFLNIWREFGSLIRCGAFGFDYKNFRDFDRFLRENRYPVMHHSSTYNRLYSPSYRVVRMDIFDKIFDWS
jgi:hypothetical protein